MPVTRGAEKKLRQDKKREKTNLIVKRAVSRAIKDYKKSPSEKKLAEVYSVLDTSVKKKIFHKNKASRLKSNLSKYKKTATSVKNKKK